MGTKAKQGDIIVLLSLTALKEHLKQGDFAYGFNYKQK